MPNAVLPFIVQRDGGYVVDQATVETLTAQIPKDSPIRVFAIAGLYRTGKSGLLKILFECDFPTSDTTQSCTKGIWISYWRDRNILVLDTEGFGSREAAGAGHDASIFALGVILSTYFCYNSRGNIDDTALSTIAANLNICRAVAEDASVQFPAFTWLLRDFTLSLTSTTGSPITASEYMEAVLRPESHHDEAKRRIRDTVRTLFPTRSCVTLIRPCDREDDLAALTNLRPEFRDQVATFRTHLVDCIRPMTRDGIALSFGLFARLAKRYVHAINNGAVPRIRDTWTLLCGSHNQDLLRKVRYELEAFCERCENERKIRAQLDRAMATLRNVALSPTDEFVRDASVLLESVAAVVIERVRRARDDRLRAQIDELERTAGALPLSELRGRYDALTRSFGEGDRAFRAAFESTWRVVPDRVRALVQQLKARCVKATAERDAHANDVERLRDRSRELEAGRMALERRCKDAEEQAAAAQSLERQLGMKTDELRAVEAVRAELAAELKRAMAKERQKLTRSTDDGPDPRPASAETARVLEKVRAANEELNGLLNAEREKSAAQAVDLDALADAANRLDTVEQERDDAVKAQGVLRIRLEQATEQLRTAEARLLGEAEKLEADAMETVTAMNQLLEQERTGNAAARAKWAKRSADLTQKLEGVRELQKDTAGERDQLKTELADAQKRLASVTAEKTRIEHTQIEDSNNFHHTIRKYAQQAATIERERSRHELDMLQKVQTLKEQHRTELQERDMQRVQLRARLEIADERLSKSRDEAKRLRDSLSGRTETAARVDVLRGANDELKGRLHVQTCETDKVRHRVLSLEKEIATLKREHATEKKRLEMSHIKQMSRLQHQLSDFRRGQDF